MKKLTTTICLTIAVLLGSAGMSESAEFQKGLAAAQSGDYATARRIWTPLAEQGHSTAAYNLGTMYIFGHGVSPDDKIALKWHSLAAEHGHLPAMTSLGWKYATGGVVKKDRVRAHMWWNIAAASGYKNAVKARDKIEKKMTPAQIAEAKKLARECSRKELKGC